MNVLRSMARTLFGASRVSLDLGRVDGSASRVPKVAQLERNRDSFEQLPQKASALRTVQAERSFFKALQSSAGLRDGFDGVRHRPVDLSGGVAAPKVQAAKPEGKPAPVAPNGFSASVDDFA